MNVFISWSGERSHEVANLLSDWLCCVLQAIKPWISSRDIDRGSIWFDEINNQLKDTAVGIICLTQENKDQPWILFEAGALAKGLPTSRVCTLLIDLQTRDIEAPLAQFNHTIPEKESIFKLVKTLNGTLGPSTLDIRILEKIFNTYWPQFETQFEEIIKNTESKTPAKPRAEEEVLGEILEITRALTTRIRRIERDIDRSPERRINIKSRLRDEVANTMSTPLSTEDIIKKDIIKMHRSEIPLDFIINKFERFIPSEKIIKMIDDYECSEITPKDI